MGETVIALKDVSKIYGSGHTQVMALAPTTFTVETGTFVAIIGPSGSGKSTLLTVMAGLQEPNEGSVELDHQAFNQLSEKDNTAFRFDHIGFILQASNLVPFLTVEKQFFLIDKVAKRPKQTDKVTEIFEGLGITSLSKKYPSDLSGGERQRVAIGKALYNDANIILADEPTASLDSEKAHDVIDIFAKEVRQRQCAVVMVTHDLRLITKCDYIYRMEDGHLTDVTSKIDREKIAKSLV